MGLETQEFQIFDLMEVLMAHEWVWIFNGNGIRFPSGVFEEKETAELWIRPHQLAGMLTKYPVGISAYDWALEHKYFTPKKEHHKTAEFIGRFTCGCIDHDHYGDEPAPVVPECEDAANKKVFAVNGWVWVFSGDGGIIPSGAFKTQAQAESWIERYCLSGTLSKYPVGISVYDWAIQNNLITPENDLQRGASFMCVCGRDYGEHLGYKDGLRLGT